MRIFKCKNKETFKKFRDFLVDKKGCKCFEYENKGMSDGELLLKKGYHRMRLEKPELFNEYVKRIEE